MVRTSIYVEVKNRKKYFFFLRKREVNMSGLLIYWWWKTKHNWFIISKHKIFSRSLLYMFWSLASIQVPSHLVITVPLSTFRQSESHFGLTSKRKEQIMIAEFNFETTHQKQKKKIKKTNIIHKIIKKKQYVKKKYKIIF